MTQRRIPYVLLVLALLLAALPAPFVAADGTLGDTPNPIGAPYGSTRAIDRDDDAACTDTQDRGDLIDFHAFSAPNAANGSRWFFAFVVDSDDALNAGNNIDQPNYFVILDDPNSTGANGNDNIPFWTNSSPYAAGWTRNMRTPGTHFVACYASGADTLNCGLYDNHKQPVSGVGAWTVTTTTLGGRRYVELALPDDADVPAYLRNNSAINTLLISTYNSDNWGNPIDAVGTTVTLSCHNSAKELNGGGRDFVAAEMVATAANCKTGGRPTAPGVNDRQCLSFPARNSTSALTDIAACSTATAGLLLTPAAAAAQAQNPVRGDDGGDGTIVTMATLRDVNDLPGASGQVGPDLLVTSFLAPSATVPLTPGTVETFLFTARPIWTASGEHVDSFLQFGPKDWPIDAISAAPANNRGNGLAVGQSHQDPNTGGNTTDYAQAYWGYVATGGNPFNYVNGAGITPPTRSRWSYSNWGVYTAAASGLPTNEVEVWTDFSVPASWSAYLCPGANLGTPDEFIGMSGVSTDPNYMETWLYSSDCSSLSCPVDAYQIPLLACRQPAVSVTKTGTVTGVTGNPGGSGTVTVQYCFVVTNATTPGAGVHLASHQVTDATIGYNSGVVTYALAPGASAPALCTSYTHSVTWPTTGNVCVYNTSGASAIGTTPSGWRETTAGNPGAGFSSGTFTSPAATGGVNLQTCASPLAVTLAEFSAAQQGDAVQVSWETVSELDNAGFNLYRSESAAGPQTLLAYLPSSSPGGTAGAAYSYEDRAGLVPGTTYFYWLEDVATSGATTLHGPVSVDYSAPTAVTLSGVAANPGPATALPWLWIVAGAGTALGASRLRRRGQAR